MISILRFLDILRVLIEGHSVWPDMMWVYGRSAIEGHSEWMSAARAFRQYMEFTPG